MTVRKTATYASGLTRQIPSWQRAVLAAVVMALALVQLSGSRAAVAATPAEVGQWSAPVDWPLVAVHMSLLPTGQVLAFDAWDAAPNSERLWDPATGAFTPVPYGRNLFCAGHVQLADGRTLIVGGNVAADVGLADTTIYDPQTRTYFRGRDMSVARWYPTATAACGRTRAHVRRRQHRSGPTRSATPRSRTRLSTRFRRSTTRRRTHGPTSRPRG